MTSCIPLFSEPTFLGAFEYVLQQHCGVGGHCEIAFDGEGSTDGMLLIDSIARFGGRSLGLKQNEGTSLIVEICVDVAAAYRTIDADSRQVLYTVQCRVQGLL